MSRFESADEHRTGIDRLDPSIVTMVREAAGEPSPPSATSDVNDRRLAYRERALIWRGEMESVAQRRDVVLALGDRSLPARLYVPEEEEGSALVVYFHGGSFVVGDLDTHEGLCRRLAARTRMRFLAIGYRLAPEYPFPAPLNDACDALRYVSAHVSEFAPSSSRIVVLGDSAGGNLATVAASLTRGEDLGITAQVLVYPSLGPDLVTPSAHEFANGFLVNLDLLRYDYEMYIGQGVSHTDPRVTPILSSDLTGCPPAVIVVAECDPLRDEGVMYAGLLENFGVSVKLLEARGMVHGFLRLSNLVPRARDVIDEIGVQLRELVGR